MAPAISAILRLRVDSPLVDSSGHLDGNIRRPEPWRTYRGQEAHSYWPCSRWGSVASVTSAAVLARMGHVTIPARKAASAASTRLRTPSFTKIPEIWVFTVVSLR